MAELKYSRQREALLKELRSRHDHPTADVLYHKLREEYPRISLGTVYRNLALLCELGEVKKITCGDGIEHYDGFVSMHDHFVCTRCGRVIDIAQTAQDIRPSSAASEIGSIESHSLIYYGMCKECYNKTKKQ